MPLGVVCVVETLAIAVVTCRLVNETRGLEESVIKVFVDALVGVVSMSGFVVIGWVFVRLGESVLDQSLPAVDCVEDTLVSGEVAPVVTVLIESVFDVEAGVVDGSPEVTFEIVLAVAVATESIVVSSVYSMVREVWV